MQLWTLAREQGWVEFEFIPKLLINLNVGFQNSITKNLNATLKSLNLIFLIKDLMNLDFFSYLQSKILFCHWFITVYPYIANDP